MTAQDLPCNGGATFATAGSQSDAPLDATVQDQKPEAGLQDVQVDQCALVNILARYPGEFDVLRELIQNADDAEAKNVKVHFLTEDLEKSQSTDISKVMVCRWIVVNDGNAFTDEDWGRLKKIADGNKNCSKVGAFGVGFYSVLSKTDEPLVKSSSKAPSLVIQHMELRNQFVNCSAISGTSIELELRTREPLPKLDNLARFLVSSVTFLTNIETAEVYLDDIRLLHIHKEPCKSPVEVPIPEHLVGVTPSKALTIKSIECTAQTITIDAAECTFPSEPTSSSVVDTADTIAERRGGPAEDHITRASQSVNTVLEANAITHDLYIAAIDVNLQSDSDMSRGINSCMKSLPSTFECKAVYFNPEQSDTLHGIKNSRSHIVKHLASIFSGPQGIFPENDRRGQSTNQTTGIGLHISAHFLPTMERSSIDLANGQVAAWNEEVLWVAGFLARVVTRKRCIRPNLKMTWDESGLGHDGAFRIRFYCTSLWMVTAGGIGCASDAQFRQSNKDLSFLKKYRVLHEEIKDHQCCQIIAKYDIPRFRYGDIVREFETGVTREALRSFFSWWEDTRRNSLTTDEARNAAEKFCTEFASRAILHTSHDARMELKSIKYYTFFPLPNGLSHPKTIYIDVSSSSPPARDAVEAFGWSQLSLLHWLEYAHDQAQQHTIGGASGPDSDIGYSISLAVVQFALVENLSEQDWARVAELMRDLKCIPTNMGLKTPGESYFEEADVCKSLPVALELSGFASIPTTPVVSKTSVIDHKQATPDHIRSVLVRIRVCQVMEWEHMIKKLEVAASEETNVRLLQFLHLRSDLRHPLLPNHWRNDLQEKKVFYSQSHGPVSATELYLHHGDVLKLKLPILSLDGLALLQNIDGSSDSLQVEPFVQSLGVKKYPPLKKVIDLAASNEPEVQKFALQYLLSNFDTHYSDYKSGDFAHVAFIPTQTGLLARLNKVFASPIWEKLGFELVSKDLARDYARLGVRDDPSVEMIIEYLKVPTTTLPDIEAAAKWFDLLYVHGKLPIQKLGEHLSTIPFVPVKNSSVSSSRPSFIDYISPKDCFIGSTDAKAHHHRVFSFVDFGQNGGAFLEHCGARKSPEPSDIARKICQGPERYLEALENNYELYLEDLDTIASHLESISNDDKQAMKKAPMFLAYRNGDKRLLRADQVIISDWSGRGFGGDVFTVPKDSLEKMYREMGSEFLRAYVQYDIEHTGYQAGFKKPFEERQVIRRIKCFMDQRDKCVRTGISFYNHEKASHLEVKICRKLTLKKKFAPPFGMLADGVFEKIVETKVKAGLKFDETNKSYTLWVVKDANEPVRRNDIAVGLCQALLETYGPDDVLLLVSLFAMDDNDLDTYYGSETNLKLPDPPAKDKPEKGAFELRTAIGKVLAFRVFKLKRTNSRGRGKLDNEPSEHDVNQAIKICAQLNTDDQLPDFSARCESRSSSLKYVSRCKEACKTRLERTERLQDEETHIKFFVAEGSQYQPSQSTVLKEFAKLVSDLACVFDLKAPATCCYIFWKDTLADPDLMAFNKDQHHIFFNLAYYKREHHDKEVDKEKAAIEWFLIMAHEMAHNIALDHDEYHGALAARIAVAYFPPLRKHLHF
ncbi:hypothetical protein JVU11DRAFT_9846 [Chiua virens]|nr:hypothetical protein JVU11DRAFT_9846 [Chiua virens]